ELQIELCQLAVAGLAEVEGLSPAEKQLARMQIDREIEELRSTKQPIFVKTNLAGLETYSLEEAVRIRKHLRWKKRAFPKVKPRATFGPVNGRVVSVAFSPDGKLMASGYDGSVRVWDIAAAKQKHLLDGDSVRLRGVAFSPVGNVLASGGDGT